MEGQKNTLKRVLSGIRILDFSWVLAGPYATRLLADFGAEVIKVQSLQPQEDDLFSRGYYNTWNRNKLGVTLDLSKPEGLDIARKLVKISDAIVENFAPRVMANWGLDYPELKKLKPDIILVSLSIMGHTGPLKDYTGFGPTIQALAGITHLTAYPGKPPSGLGFSYSDHIAGLYASLALLGALEDRRKTGIGQHIDLSQVEAMASLLSDEIIDYTRDGQEAIPVGNGSSEAAPHGVYRCRGEDRWCAIAVTTDEEWQGFKRALRNPAWAEDPVFVTLSGRLRNTEKLDNLVQEWTMKHAAEKVMALLQKEGVPAGVVQNAADLAADPQLKERGFFIHLDHPLQGDTVADANPIRLSDSPAEYRRSSPLPGQDNDYVYRQLLGLSAQALEELKEKKAIS
jgi:benzylsuccinate CoA-transferase BbsF subunit